MRLYRIFILLKKPEGHDDPGLSVLILVTYQMNSVVLWRKDKLQLSQFYAKAIFWRNPIKWDVQIRVLSITYHKTPLSLFLIISQIFPGSLFHKTTEALSTERASVNTIFYDFYFTVSKLKLPIIKFLFNLQISTRYSSGFFEVLKLVIYFSTTVSIL